MDRSEGAAQMPPAPITMLMLKVCMLRTKMKRITSRGDRAVERLAEVEASITGLSDDDLLDLADIFKAEPLTLIGDMAFMEMKRRNISL